MCVCVCTPVPLSDAGRHHCFAVSQVSEFRNVINNASGLSKVGQYVESHRTFQVLHTHLCMQVCRHAHTHPCKHAWMRAGEACGDASQGLEVDQHQTTCEPKGQCHTRGRAQVLGCSRRKSTTSPGAIGRGMHAGVRTHVCPHVHVCVFEHACLRA